MDAVAKRRRKFLWCDICHKFNHKTHECYKNDDNWSIVDEANPPVLPVDDLNLMNNQATTAEVVDDLQEGVI